MFNLRKYLLVWSPLSPSHYEISFLFQIQTIAQLWYKTGKKSVNEIQTVSQIYLICLMLDPSLKKAEPRLLVLRLTR